VTCEGRLAGWGIRGVVALALVVVAGTGTALAQAAQSFEELEARQLLGIGDTATIVDGAGKKFHGTVEALDESSLTLSTDSGARMFAEDDVRRIRRRGTHSIAGAGFAGALTGFAISAIAATAFGMNEGGGACGGCLVQWSMTTVPIGAAVGTLIGFGVDLSTRRTVFAAPGKHSSLLLAPIVTPRAVGAMASIAF
jgi:hypothetical protein